MSRQKIERVHNKFLYRCLKSNFNGNKIVIITSMFSKPPCWFSLAGNLMAMAFLVTVITAVLIIDCIYTYLNTEQVIKFKPTLYLLLIWVWYKHTFHMYIYHVSLNLFEWCFLWQVDVVLFLTLLQVITVIQSLAMYFLPTQ